MSSRSLPADLAAAEALRAAEGVCARCERPSPALIAVRHGGELRAECLDRARCRRSIREQLAEEGAER